MSEVHLRIRRGAVIIFEGLDQTGKSTQLSRLRSSAISGSTVFAHMPSGSTMFTKRVYAALEGESAGEKPKSGLAQQLAHLACHAESISDLSEAVETQSLILDRWWWSTLAYGWYGGSVRKSGLSESSFRELISTIWAQIIPSVVFVFLEPHGLDTNNTEGARAGYRSLVDDYSDLAVVIPRASEEETHTLVTNVLLNRGLACRAETRDVS